ncbi:MAG: hypothetical protein A2V90_02010 [Gammaproteobacteria bacterium RBG_16_57_12]|nr:MAG: hypothetical protein A2V90_02010 [Gammaproteobacteria bacterium RBG_16_57_12]
MLEFIRNRAQGWLAWVIVAMLIVPFALWGINEYFTAGDVGGVAKVNGKEISSGEFRQAYLQQRERMQESLGEAYDPAIFDSKLKDEVLTGLIDQELLVQLGQEAGFRVGDQQLGSIIHSIDDFQRDGEFSKEVYEEKLRGQGQSPTAFEQRLRRAVISSQLYAGLAETTLVTRADLENVRSLMMQKREVSYLLVPVARFSKDLSITQADIEKYYSQNSASFVTPERVSIEYLELDAGQFAKDVQVTEQVLQDLYEAQKASFAVEEERRASHILLEVAADASDKDVEAARVKAEDILKRVKNNEPFAALAKQYSNDPGSADNGGDLGFFAKNTMDPAFEQAVFALNKGETSSLVRTPYGFHIIRLDDIKSGTGRSFAQVREELEKRYRLKEAERIYLDQRERLANLSFENSGTLAVAADELKLPIKSTALFSRQEADGITADAKGLKATFSDDVLQNSLNSEIIDVTENHSVVLRVKEHIPSAQRPLQDVQEGIRAILTRQAASDKVRAAGSKALERLKSGEDTKIIAAELGLSWSDLGLIRRDYREGDKAVVDMAFRLPRVKEGANYGGAETAAGDYALIRVSRIEDDTAPMGEAEKLALSRTLNSIYGNTEYSAFIEKIKKQADISINKDNL